MSVYRVGHFEHDPVLQDISQYGINTLNVLPNITLTRLRNYLS